jgi:hypothetical protein
LWWLKFCFAQHFYYVTGEVFVNFGVARDGLRGFGFGIVPPIMVAAMAQENAAGFA